MSAEANPTSQARRRRRRSLHAAAVVALAWLLLAGMVPSGNARADERDALADIESDMVDAAKESSAANRELADLRRKITDEQAKVADAGRRRDDAHARVRDWVRVAYKSGGTVYYSFLVGDPALASTRADYLSRIAQKSRDSGNEARVAKEDADSHLAALQDLESRATRRAEEAEALQKSLEQKQVEQQRRLAERLEAEKAAAASAAAQPSQGGSASGGGAAGAGSSSVPAAAPTAGGGAAPAAPSGGSDGGVFEVTCYSEKGSTASGKPTGPGVAATDTRVIPRGTSFLVHGYGVFTSWDTGGAIKGNRIDIWNESEAWCLNFGRRKLNVTIY